MADVRITVVKRLDNQELFGDNPPLTFTGVGLCDRFEEGQVTVHEGGNATVRVDRQVLGLLRIAEEIHGHVFVVDADLFECP